VALPAAFMPHARHAALTHARARIAASTVPSHRRRPLHRACGLSWLLAPRQGAHMYFCGLKGMMPGILDMLEGVSKEKGLVWEDKLKEWKTKGQWHVEVY